MKPLAKNVLISLGLTAAASGTNAPIQKKVFRSGCPLDIALRIITLIISNEETNDVMKIITSLEESGLLVKGVSEPMKNKAKEKKDYFFVCYYIH